MNDFDVVFYLGGYGLLWDLVNDVKFVEVIKIVYEQDKVIGVVCYVFVVFWDVEVKSGQNLVGGCNVIGFSNSEEEVVGLINVVFFLLEDMLKEKIVIYIWGDDFILYIVVDGKLIIGQNLLFLEGIVKVVIQVLQ